MATFTGIFIGPSSVSQYVETEGNDVDAIIPYDVLGQAEAGAGGTTYFKKRARDSACVPVTYVTWVTTDPLGAYPGILPCGGPLVEETVVEIWRV